MKDSDKTKKQADLNFNDITERVRVEEIRINEKKYRDIFENSILGIILCEIIRNKEGKAIDFIHLDANESASINTGFQLEDIIGKKVSELVGKKLQSELTERYEKVIATHRSVSYIKYFDVFKKTLQVTASYLNNDKFIINFIDISESKKAEEELLQSKIMLDATQQIAKVGGWQFDVSTQKIFWTDETYRIHDFDPEKYPQGLQEHISKSLECYEPEDRDMIMQAFNDCVEKGIEYDLEVTFTSDKGKNKWVRTSAVPVYENDKIVKVNGTLQDITDLKKTEEQIRYQANLLENVSDSIFATDREFNIQFWNSAAEKQYGWAKEDVLGKHFAKFIQPKYPEDSRRIVINSILRDGLWSGELIYHRRDGSLFPVQTTISQVKNSEGKVIGHISVNRDITERKQTEKELLESEKKYRTFFENNDAIILFINPENGEIIFANEAAVEFYGYSKEQLTKMNINKLNTLSTEEIKSKMAEARKNNKNYFVFKHILASGEIRDVEVYQTKLLFDQKEIFSIIVHDITKRKRAEKIRETLFNISNVVNTSDNLPELFTKIREELGNIMDITNLYIALYNEKTDMISLPYNTDIQDVYETFPAGKTLTKYVIQTGESIFADTQIIDELTKQGKIELVGDPSLIWMGVPLKIEDKVIGVIAIQSYDDPDLYTIDDMGTLKFVSEEIALAINRKRSEEQIKRDLQEKTTLLKELYHRTKNNMQVISSMLKMQSRNIENLTISGDKLTDFLYESFNVIINRIRSMSMVHEKLYQAQDLSHINLKGYIKDLTNSLISNYNIHSESISLKLELEDIFVLIDLAIPLGLVLNEMISNAFKHAYSDKGELELIIRLYKEKDETMNIQVCDNGVGMPKDIDLKNLNSLGIKTIYNLIKYQLNGQIRYDTDNGLKWHIRLKDKIQKARV